MRPPLRFSLHLPSGDVLGATVNVNSRAKRISLRLDPVTREAFLTTPHERYSQEAQRFAQERVFWLAAQLARLSARPLTSTANGLLIRGIPTEVRHIAEGRGVSLADGPPQTILVRGRSLTAQTVTARALAFCRELARADLAQSAALHATTLGVKVAGITIKDTRSRWGSCTAAGQLSFCWRLIGAPPSVLDYVAAHEVAHMREMNHSDRFWAHVRRCCPNYATERAWLKTHGHSLYAMQI